MKILIISLVVIVFLKCINGDCTAYQCLSVGDSCKIAGKKCPPGSYCEISYDNPLCETSKKVSESCTYQSQCEDGLFCYNSGEDQFCANIRYKGQGEICKKDLECSESMICANKTCTYIGTECTLSSCKAGTFCNVAKKCQNNYEDGSQCTLDIECKANSRCMVTSNAKVSKCTAINSLPGGVPCNSIDSCDIGLDLVCFQGYCVEFSDKLVANSTCYNTNECIFDKEQCICDSVSKPKGTGTCTQTNNIGSSCKNAKLDYFNCLADSGCPLKVSNQFSNETCVVKKCDELKCTYQQECLDADYFCGQGPICSDSSPLLKYSFFLLSTVTLLLSL